AHIPRPAARRAQRGPDRHHHCPAHGGTHRRAGGAAPGAPGRDPPVGALCQHGTRRTPQRLCCGAARAAPGAARAAGGRAPLAGSAARRSPRRRVSPAPAGGV
ncbi:MAG: hypothetical protein AVDCRST_MAG77-2523, partial [uncultured Chloroflexi bacterium]